MVWHSCIPYVSFHLDLLFIYVQVRLLFSRYAVLRILLLDITGSLVQAKTETASGYEIRQTGIQDGMANQVIAALP